MKEEIKSQQTLSGPGLFFHLDSHSIFCIDSISFHNSQFIGFLVFQDKVNSGQKLSGYNDDRPFGSDALLKLLVSLHHCRVSTDGGPGALNKGTSQSFVLTISHMAAPIMLPAGM